LFQSRKTAGAEKSCESSSTLRAVPASALLTKALILAGDGQLLAWSMYNCSICSANSRQQLATAARCCGIVEVALHCSRVDVMPILSYGLPHVFNSQPIDASADCKTQYYNL